MNITDRSTATQIITAITTTEAKVPKTVTDTYARAVKLSEATRNLSAGSGALAVAVAAALEDGRDPTADPEVQRVLTASQLANDGVMQAVDGIAFDRFRDVCREHADTIVAALRKPFDQAAAALNEAHDRIGSVPLDNTAAIIAKGGDAADAWASAQAASATIEAVVSGWSALGDFTRLAPLAPRYRTLRLAAVDLDTWHNHRLAHGTATPWEAVLAGLDLHLPTFSEYRDRVRSLEDQQAQADVPELDPLRTHIAGRPIRVAS